MSQVCGICTSPNRLEVDRALIAGRSLAGIAREFGVSVDCLSRHKAGHLSRQLLKSAEIRELVSLDTLASDVAMMRERCLDVMERARKRNWLNTELRSLGELRSVYTFMTSLCLDLERMKQDQNKTSLRLQADALKQNLSKDELEFLQFLLEKASIPLETT